MNDWRGVETVGAGTLNWAPLKPDYLICPGWHHRPYGTQRIVAWCSGYEDLGKLTQHPGLFAGGIPKRNLLLKVQPPWCLSRECCPRLGRVWKGGVKPKAEVVRHKALGVSQAHHALIHSPRSRLSLRLSLPEVPELDMEQCCHLVDMSCNYNVNTSLTGASIHKNYGVLKEMGILKERILDSLTDLPLEKSVCRSGSNSQNWTWNNRLVPDRESSMSRLYIVTLLI